MEDGGGVSATDRVGSPSPVVDHKAGHPGEMSFVSSNERPTVFQRGGGNQNVSVTDRMAVSSTVSPRSAARSNIASVTRGSGISGTKHEPSELCRRVLYLVPTKKFKPGDWENAKC